MKFYLDDAKRELKEYSPLLEDIYQKSYLEGYPIEGVKYSLYTKNYIKNKRDKFYMIHTMFKKQQ